MICSTTRQLSSRGELERSNTAAFVAKKNRILKVYAIADGLAEPGAGDPTVVVCLDEFGPLNLQPQPNGKTWASLAKPRRTGACCPASLCLIRGRTARLRKTTDRSLGSYLRHSCSRHPWKSRQWKKTGHVEPPTAPRRAQARPRARNQAGLRKPVPEQDSAAGRRDPRSSDPRTGARRPATARA